MYKNISIIILFLAVFMLLDSKKVPDSLPIVVTNIDTFYKDTTIIKWKSGKNIIKDTVIHDTIPQLIAADTISILKDYFAKNIYKDTILLPEGLISITDTISQNSILGRSYLAKITQKTIRVVKELRTPAPAPKGQMYWGVMAIQGQQGELGFGGGLIYKSPYKGIIQLNYTNSKQIQLGYYSKIF
jgi:hypothetical protein